MGAGRGGGGGLPGVGSGGRGLGWRHLDRNPVPAGPKETATSSRAGTMSSVSTSF